MTSSHAKTRIRANGDGQAARLPLERIIVDLVLLFFVLLLAEGVIRKWLLPQAEAIFGFVRDPVLIAIYCVYLANLRGRFPRWLAIYCAAAALFVAYTAVYIIVSGLPLIIGIFGIRSYIMYVPLAFIIGDCFDKSDIRRFIRLALWLAIPSALLVFVQFVSPVSSFINKGTGDETEGRFMVVAGIVRPYGPFTFAQAQATFAVMMLALSALAFDSRLLRLRGPLLLVAAAATFAMGALSGSRTFFGGAALVCLMYVAAGLTSPKVSLGFQRLALIVALVAAFGVTFAGVFPRAFSAMLQRQAEAQRFEGSTVGRAASFFTTVSEPFLEAPMFGYGPGSGSNAAAKITGSRSFTLGEYEWGRMVNELGPVSGTLAILFRVGIFVWLGLISLRANARASEGSALIFFGFAGYLVLIAQVTAQNQLLSFCWLAVGINVAMAKAPFRKAKSAAEISL